MPEDHPVRAAYTRWNDGNRHTRSSWDPITVYCAVRSDTPLYRRVPMHVTVDENGVTVSGPGHDMACLVQNASDEAVITAIDPLLL